MILNNNLKTSRSFTATVTKIFSHMSRTSHLGMILVILTTAMMSTVIPVNSQDTVPPPPPPPTDREGDNFEMAVSICLYLLIIV